MGWAEWWLVGLAAGFLWRCIYEALNYDRHTVPKWALTLTLLVILLASIHLTVNAVCVVFGDVITGG